MSRKPYKSRAFLQWAKGQGGACCICGDNGRELYHIGDHGMGQKGSDLLVARVCRKCHEYVQGKRRIAFERMDESIIPNRSRLHVAPSIMGGLGTWADLQADALELLAGYVEHLEARNA